MGSEPYLHMTGVSNPFGRTMAEAVELNDIWVRALSGPMHLGLRTGPLCPMFYTKLEDALFL